MLMQLVELATQAQTLPEKDGALITQRLAEALFVDALQIMLRDGMTTQPGLLAGLQDANIARALAMIHRRYASDLTMGVLAGTAGLSRSVFAARFRHRVGTTPARYLQRWRIQLAAEALSCTDGTTQTIADAVGFTSQTSFFRAFKRETGMTPMEWRIQHRETGRIRRKASIDAGSRNKRPS